MVQPAGQFRASVAVRFTRYDFQNADERITQVKAHVDRQRATLATLEPGSPDARWVGQVLAAMERTLRYFQEHRGRIEGDLSDVACGPG